MSHVVSLPTCFPPSPPPSQQAASAYDMAKRVIRLITAVGAKINNDPDTKDYLRLYFLPDYNVSLAEVGDVVVRVWVYMPTNAHNVLLAEVGAFMLMRGGGRVGDRGGGCRGWCVPVAPEAAPH